MAGAAWPASSSAIAHRRGPLPAAPIPRTPPQHAPRRNAPWVTRSANWPGRASRADAPYAREYKVAGPLCDSGDVYFDIEREGRLPDYRKLPEDVVPGEVLALLNCGAYSLAQMFHYNGRPLPAAVLIRRDGKPALIRRRDTYDDLIANDTGY